MTTKMIKKLVTINENVAVGDDKRWISSPNQSSAEAEDLTAKIPLTMPKRSESAFEEDDRSRPPVDNQGEAASSTEHSSALDMPTIPTRRMSPTKIDPLI